MTEGKIYASLLSKTKTLEIKQRRDLSYYIIADGVNISTEYMLPNVYSREEALNEALKCLKFKQNSNRTHPLKYDMINMINDEQKNNRIEKRRYINTQNKH